MSSSTSRFTILFRAVGQNELKKVRSVLRGIEQQSYTSLNAFNRNMSSMEKNTIKALNSIDKRVGSMNKSFRTFSMLGLAFSPLMAGFGALASATALVNRAFIQTNSQMQTSKILIEELLGNKGSAKEFVGVMQDLSASFGTDMSETMNSSRGLLQVMKQVGKGDVAPKHLDKMLKMVMAVGAMDIENRGLSYTAFSFKEAMQGLGQGDFRSLRNRLEINLGKETEKAITRALKSGNLEEAINLFDTGLKRIGIDSEKLLKRLNKEGFVQNISRTQAYFSRMFQLIGEKFYYSLTTPIYKFNSFLETQFKDGSRGMQILTNLGTSLYYAFNPALEKLKEIGLALYNNREAFATSLSGLISSGGGLAKSMGTTFLSFFKGLFGIKNDSKSQVEDMILMMKTLSLFADKATAMFDKLSPILKMVGTSIHNILSELGKFAVNSGLMGAGGGLIGLAGTIASGIGEGIASILATINNIIGNQYSVNPNTGEPNQQSNLMQNAVNTAIIGGTVMQLLSMRKGKVPTAIGGTTGATNAEASAVASNGKIFDPVGIKFNPTNPYDSMMIQKKASIIAYNKANETLLRNQQERISINSVITDYEKTIKRLKETSLKTEGVQARDLKSKRRVYDQAKVDLMESELLKLKPRRDILDAEIFTGMRNVRDLEKSAKRAKDGGFRATLNASNKTKTVTPSEQPSIWQRDLKQYLPSLEQTAMGAMIIGSLSPILGMFKGMFTGGSGIFAKLGTGIGGIVSKFGLLGLSLTGLSGAILYAQDAILGFNKKIEDEDNRAGDEALKTHKIKQFRDFIKSHGFSIANINKTYEGVNGKKMTPQQIAMMYNSPIRGINYVGGFNNERDAYNTLVEAFKNRTIDKETASQFFSENTMEALAGETLQATMNAQIELAGMDTKMIKQFEEVFSNTLAKVLKNSNNGSGINGTLINSNTIFENSLKIMGNN